MAILSDSQGRRFEWQLVAISAACVLFAVLAATLFRATLAGGPPQIPVDTIMGWVTTCFLALAVLILGLAWTHHRWFFSGRQRLRRSLGGQEGYVNEHDLRETCGDAAVLREAYRFWGRPPGSMTVEQASWEIGELISGRWTVRSQPMRAAYPRSAIVVGPQGGGKSQYLISRILDAPGPALVTSTKTELINATAAWRAAHAGPVVIFDPLNMTGGLHNQPFDPVWGCSWADPAANPSLGGVLDNEYADVMATAMIRGASLSKKMHEEFWADIGREILRCYLFAADLIGQGSMTVQRWVHDPDDPQPVSILSAAGDKVPAGWLSLLTQRLATNRRQRDGYFATVSSCMEYLAVPGAREACRRPGLDVSNAIANLLDSRSTLYIVGNKSRRGIASLMTALTESIYYRTRQYASKQPREAMAEPLIMFLDEVANLTPVDLPNWITETRGAGVMIIPVIQSRPQLDVVWGADQGKVIFDNAVTHIVLGSLADERTLEDLSRLAGERRVEVRSDGTRTGASASYRLERVIPMAAIRSLPFKTAFVLGYARNVAVVEFEAGYERLERERSGLPRRPAWPRWWRHPLRATAVALELGRGADERP